MPAVSEIPDFISRVSHPRRSRSVSVGPQSAADAHEALALRREMRKEKQGSASGFTTGSEHTSSTAILEDAQDQLQEISEAQSNPGSHESHTQDEQASPIQEPSKLGALNSLPESQGVTRSPSQDRRQNEKEEREIFSHVQKPRVRYDVEVVTKLIVYSGKSS